MRAPAVRCDIDACEPSLLPLRCLRRLLDLPSSPHHAAAAAGAYVERPVPYPVFESRGFARAVQRGTRTRTGEPGRTTGNSSRAIASMPSSCRRRARSTDARPCATSIARPIRSASFGSFSIRICSRRGAARIGPAPVTGGMEILRIAVGGTRRSRSETRRRLLDRRHADACCAAAGARAERLRRLRHRVGVPASARRRAARGHDRRRLHGRVLVSAARRLRRRQRLADRPLPRQRRVLHGLRATTM